MTSVYLYFWVFFLILDIQQLIMSCMPNIGTMSYARYKTIGNKKYAYEITSYWDKNTKSPRQRVKYLGPVDENGEIIKKSDYEKHKEKYILDFGEGFLLSEVLKKTGIDELIQEVFKKDAALILSLLIYRVTQPSAMMYAQHWYEGNVVRFIYKTKGLSSQGISRVLKVLGDEGKQREFFKKYIRSFTKPVEGIIIDTTALLSKINFLKSSDLGKIDKHLA
ncbi:hypothetical protein [Thermodesulfovibrio hydrogeniphilus]